MNSDNKKQDNLRSAFFDQADILFSLFDKDLFLIDVNEAFLKTFHFKRKDLIGKHITEISPDVESSGRLDLYKEVILTGKTIVIDDVKAHPSLGNVYARIKLFKVDDGVGAVTKNITDLKEAIEELETFIYKSSHDMRGPIASILGIISLAESGIKDLEEAQQFCRLVEQQTKRLDTILQILVETTRIRKGEKTIHLINFKNIIDEVIKSLELTNGFKEIKFEQDISIGQKFYSDKLIVISLFQNLIENASKYKKENIGDSFIKVSIEDEKGGINITVADNGIGIPENFQKDVFKMFFRATDKASGSGLGLYTVKHLVKKLGGSISLKSTEKIGTIFTVYLPNEIINYKE